MVETIKAPFPWFGGKSRVAHIVWERFGNPINYVEPFSGSLAVLLGRPHEPRTETVNDLDCYLANFWRATQQDALSVAEWADNPINEADLHARHQWLVDQETFRERMKSDPDFFDPKIAGWWVWGVCQWIGSGWCSHKTKGINSISKKIPLLSTHGWQGVLSPDRRRPFLSNGTNQGVTAKRPILKRGGYGVHRYRPDPQDYPGGRGVLSASRPLLEYFDELRARLRNVRVCCGDWKRVLGPSPTWQIGTTAIFLDPPYGEKAARDMDIYNEDSGKVASDVREWAVEHGNNKLLRIALCGYDGEHTMPADWDCVAWTAPGGMGNIKGGENNTNRFRERIWFSPHCLKPQPELF